MSALLPEDPVTFVARAEKATNDADVDWAMNVHAPSIRLETYGDGLLDVHDGTDAVRKAVTTLYGWLQDIDGHIRKTFVAASGDALVNHWNGTLFGGRHASYGAEFWYFDDTGHVVRKFSTSRWTPSRYLTRSQESAACSRTRGRHSAT